MPAALAPPPPPPPAAPVAAMMVADVAAFLGRTVARAGCTPPAPAAPEGLDPPTIRQSRIPFGAERRAQMRRYARRHYGLSCARLGRPRVIVEHIAATRDLRSVINTFSANRPDPELGELPGTCSHYVIDRTGAIHQLVSLRWMCRHTVGLNHTSVGIEHVGLRDADLMGNRRQLRASVALTRWLMARYGIARRNVIGHNESLSSRYHKELVARLRSQTHGDMQASSMRRYRRMLVP